MKVIYVDIDGPLATDECSNTLVDTKWHRKLYRMNPKCVAILNEIITETDCELVISSDWRIHFSLEELGEIFEWNEIIKKPIAITDKLNRVSMSNLSTNRIDQIKESIEKLKPEKWVSIDDLPLSDKHFKEGLTNYVFCDPIDGLTGKNVKEDILKFLL